MIVSARRRPAAHRPGFTLLEVLVVVAILVILAGVAGVYVFGFLDGAKVDTARAQIASLETAAKAFNVKYGQQPTSLVDLVDPAQSGQFSNTVKPLVEGGQQALIDPWGHQQYQFNFQNYDNYGGFDPMVWTYENGDQNKPIYSARRAKTR